MVRVLHLEMESRIRGVGKGRWCRGAARGSGSRALTGIAGDVGVGTVCFEAGLGAAAQSSEVENRGSHGERDGSSVRGGNPAADEQLYERCSSCADSGGKKVDLVPSVGPAAGGGLVSDLALAQLWLSEGWASEREKGRTE